VILGLEFKTYTFNHSSSSFLWWVFFWDRVSQTICLGWLQTAILLISTSWVARITGVSHQHPIRGGAGHKHFLCFFSQSNASTGHNSHNCRVNDPFIILLLSTLFNFVTFLSLSINAKIYALSWILTMFGESLKLPPFLISLCNAKFMLEHKDQVRPRTGTYWDYKNSSRPWRLTPKKSISV
jgi:hypothetical protein